jgi:hypothetical protein
VERSETHHDFEGGIDAYRSSTNPANGRRPVEAEQEFGRHLKREKSIRGLRRTVAENSIERFCETYE